MKIERIQKLTKPALEDITNLHFKVLQESFINRFGIEFVKESYLSILKNPENIFLALTEKDKLIGYLVATPSGERFNRKAFFQSFWKLFFEMLKSFAKNP